MPLLVPEEQRRFALEVVRRLRAAGFEAYWAGGCVRDELLGRPPKDYDVATDARPEQIRDLFGQKQTLAIGAAFGVITVLGPKQAGMVEVATFRQDAAYSDGRHPDHVTFSSAREDAARRDFTINGMFFDPLERQGDRLRRRAGRLARRVIRGDRSAAMRFAEDKLRMLRAVRFSAAFGFSLDAETPAAIGEMAGQIARRQPRADRHGNAAACWSIPAAATRSACCWRPGWPPRCCRRSCRPTTWDGSGWIARWPSSGAWSTPASPWPWRRCSARMADATAGRQVCRRWRLSNHKTGRVVWLLEHRADLAGARTKPWSALQPLLVSKGIDDLLALHAAAAPEAADDVAYCRSLLAQPRAVLDPPPLVTGDDLLAHGVPAGPKFRFLLQRIRDDQLDGRLHTPAEALAMADQLLADKN